MPEIPQHNEPVLVLFPGARRQNSLADPGAHCQYAPLAGLPRCFNSELEAASHNRLRLLSCVLMDFTVF